MSEGISIGQEEEFVDAYARALDRQHRDTHVVSLVRDSISIFRGIHPGESILSHAHSTEWIAPWCTAQKAGRRVVRLRLQAVGRWLRWLFEERHIDDNVLGYVPATVALAAGSPMLVLRCNLQRSIETYLGERRLRRADSLKSYRYYLRDFNVFVNRSQPGEGDAVHVTEAIVLAWLGTRWSTRSEKATMIAASILAGFLDFLVEAGRLPTNPIADLQRQHRVRSRQRLVGATLRGSPWAAEDRRRTFVSGLSSQFEAHVALHRALGKRFDAEVKRLQDLDRFLARESGTRLILTQDVLGRWLGSKSGLATSSARTYASTARQFCRFLHRAEPRTWIPDRSFGPVRLVQSHPYVLTPTDVRALLDAALQLGSLRWPLRPLTFHTLILVLFTTGLRITEALSLRLRDVDLVARTLFISETKFFKSRWVPFSDGLAERLSTYLCARTACVSHAKPDDSFFISAHRKKFTYSPVAAEFDRLLTCPAIRMPTQRGRRGRLHLLRHAFACHRLLAWYRAGEDVQAKLPLLATYMGHASVAGTEVYLSATAALLSEASLRFGRHYGDIIKDSQERSHHGN